MSAQPQEQPVPLKTWLAVLGAALGAFMAVLDIQIVNSSLKDIQGTLGATLDEGTWIATSYLVAEIITIPLSPWLSRVFSLRGYVLVNAILFTLFSVLCATAHDLNTMIAFRALQGFTGGVLIPMAFTIILTSLPPAKRPVGMAMFGVSATFAPSIGPALGGWITDTFGWQYIFYLNVLPGILFVTILALTLPREKMNLSLIKEGDWFGIIAMAIGLGSLEVVLEEGNRKDWFGSQLIIQLAIAATVFLIAFIWRQLTAKKPLIDLRLLTNRNFGLGAIANVSLGIGLYGSVYIIPVYLAQMQGYSALQIGEVMMWIGLPQLLIIPFVPKLMQKFDPRLLLGFGLALFATSCLMNTFMSHDFSGPQLLWSSLVRAAGQPFIIIPLSTLATSSIPPSQSSGASALFNMMRNLGGSIGIAIISTFITQREQLHGARIGEAIHQGNAALQNRLDVLTQYLVSRGADLLTAQQQALHMVHQTLQREAFTMAFNDAFTAMAVLLFAACFAVMLLKKPAATAATAEAH